MRGRMRAAARGRAAAPKVRAVSAEALRMGQIGKRALGAAGAGALVLLGFALRTMNAGEVFSRSGTVLGGNDSYYQMRRVLETLAAYPRVPLFDRALDHPFGAAAVWPPLLPWLLATICRTLGMDASSPEAVERLAAFASPIAGCLIAIPVLLLARRVTTSGGALLAAALAVSMPAHIWYSRLGFVDHHAISTLLQTTAFLCLVAAAETPVERGFGRRLRTAGAAAAIAAGLLTWNGFAVYVALADLALLAMAATARPAERRRIGSVVATSHVAAAALAAPVAAWQVSATGAPLSVLGLSFLPVLALAASACLFGGIARDWSAAEERSRPWALLATSAALGVAVLASGAPREALEWIGARDAFMSSVGESVPLLRGPSGTLDLSQAAKWLTGFALAAPAAIAWLGWRMRRSEHRRPAQLPVLLWAGGLLAAALAQRRFAESFAPALAIVTAWALFELGRAARQRARAEGWPEPWVRASPGLALVALCAFALAPYYGALLRDPGRLAAVLAPARQGPDAASPERLRRDALLAWKARLAPDAPGPEDGVMAPWPLGHAILYLTGLPVAASPFGSRTGGEHFEDWSRFFLATDEAVALEVLARRHSHWVALDEEIGTIGAAIRARGEPTSRYYERITGEDGRALVRFLPPLLETMYARLGWLIGSEALVTTADGRQIRIPPLEHFRLVQDTKEDDRPGPVKVFERVTGARLRIEGPAGTSWELRYDFESDAGRRRRYVRTVSLDELGRGEARLPYSSARADLGQKAAWELAPRPLAPAALRFRVPEAAVREGRPVSVTLPGHPGVRRIAAIRRPRSPSSHPGRSRRGGLPPTS